MKNRRLYPALFMALWMMAHEKSLAQQEAGNLNNLKINQVQILGSHNSYAAPADPRLLDIADSVLGSKMDSYLDKMSPAQRATFREYHPNPMTLSQALHYSHPDFATQLDLGLRNLEIDVYNDPEGGRFVHPAGYDILKSRGISDLPAYDSISLKEPGFKVMHIADLDFRSHYATLTQALAALKSWSDAHPGHFPVFIQMEAKDSGLPIFPNSAQVLPFDEAAFHSLDSNIVAVLGKDKIITPDQVRGGRPTLREGVLAGNWPTVKEARGKFIFLLLPGTAGLKDGSLYTQNHPSLEQRVMFVESKESDPYAAFLLWDNAIVRQKEIREAVRKGFMVRTRTDIETYEAKINDYSRAHAAFSSGAQIVSTDFYQDTNTYHNNYKIALPGGQVAIPDPVNAQP